MAVERILKAGEKAEELRKLRKELENEFKKQLLTLVTAAFGFTAALFWNTAIKDTIEEFIPAAKSWYGGIGIAVVVTVVAVLFIYAISKFTKPQEEKQ